MLAAYALSFAISAPLVALFAASICRKTLLVWALGCFGLLMLAGALVPSFGMRWLARALAGVSAAAFVPNASAVAASLAAPAERGRTLTVVFGGFTAALVLSAPLGTYVCMAFGWRVTLGALGTVALLLALMARRALPGGIMVPGATWASFTVVFAHSRLMSLLGINALGASGTFALFSLASVAFPALLNAQPSSVAGALLVFGVGALAGNAVSITYLDRIGAVRMATVAFLLTAVALGALAAHRSVSVAWAALALWGVAHFVGTTAMQTGLVAASPTLTSALLPMNSSAQFAGQSIGTAMGAAWLTMHPGDVINLAWIGFAVTGRAGAWSWVQGESSDGAMVADTPGR